MSDTLMMLSTGSNYSLEEVAEAATGPLWFQLYHRGYDLSEELVHRAEEAGFKAIVLTVDTPTASPKERDLRNRTVRPGVLANYRDQDRPESELAGTDESPGWNVSRPIPITWQELEWLRSLTSLPLVLKGIRTAEDAHIAVESGVNGIQVSTHGGPPVGHDYGRHRNASRNRRCRQGSGRDLRGLRRPPGQRRDQGPGSGRPGGCHRTATVLGAGRWTAPMGSTACWNCCVKR